MYVDDLFKTDMMRRAKAQISIPKPWPVVNGEEEEQKKKNLLTFHNTKMSNPSTTLYQKVN